MKKINIIGNQYGKLKVVSEHSTDRNGHLRWNCICECGNTCNVLGSHLKSNRTKSCGCSILKGKSHSMWNGIGEISGDYWYSHIVRSANGSKGKRKALEINITKEYCWDLFLKQNKKCALSGLEITFPKVSKDKSYTCSLDRIDSSKGYIKGNVQWVHKDINFMKNKFNQEYFIKMCFHISDFNKNI